MTPCISKVAHSSKTQKFNYLEKEKFFNQIKISIHDILKATV